jgi:hypothetical protein
MTGDGLETAFTENGKLTVHVPQAGGKSVLCAAGRGFSVRLLSENGKIYHAAPAPGADLVSILPAEAGDLEITHTRGFIRLYFSTRGRELEGLAARSSAFAKAPLNRDTRLGGRKNIFPFTMRQDGFADISTTAPGLIALYKNGRVLEVSAGTDDTERKIVRRLSRGSYEILSRPLADIPQAGILNLAQIESIDITSGNGGKKYFIGKGEVHVFRFLVSEPGTVGIGLEVENDSLRAELYDAGSQRLGEGTLLFRSLDKGYYYLVVYGASVPVQYTPLLYGHQGSDAGVPSDIIDRYKQKEGE